MKRVLLIITCLLLSGAMFYSCTPSDKDLQKQVDTVLSATNSSISSTVKEGIVTLNGTVDSEEAKTAAESTIKSIKGIKSVINEIQVTPPAVVINPDETLFNNIAAALITAGFKDIKLAVDSGVVTLTGEAKKADLEKIMQIANEARPKKVLNQLKLK